MLFLAVASGARADGPVDLDPYLRSGTSFWARGRADWLSGETAGWFQPVAEGEASDLRYPGYSDSPPLVLFGAPVHEMVLTCRSGAVNRVTCWLYSRGDAGEIAEKDFYALAASIDRALTAWQGTRGVAHPTRKPEPGIIAGAKRWPGPPTAAELRWSASKNAILGDAIPGAPAAKGFRAEFIQLAMQPAAGAQAGAAAIRGGAPSALGGSAFMIKRNVRREPDGTVLIEHIPMVDQGQRGYCAVATAERLLRYYGNNVDQHALAQLADTRTSGGTNPDDMLDVLRKGGLAYGTKVKIHEDFTVQSFLAFIDKYNAEARKADGPQIDLGQTRVIDVPAIYAAMDPDTLRRTRCERQASAMRKFSDSITSCVDQGIPLAWAVMLGVVPETVDVPQAEGGHLRIIFGYNKKTGEVLYTDSWGAGHERKSMSTADAWTITTGLYSLDPRH